MSTRMDSQQDRRTGVGGDIDRWRAARADDWRRGERHFAYTVLAVVGLALLGAVVVPMSIPDAPPPLPREQALADRYLAAIAAPDAPTAVKVEASKVPALTQDEVINQFGANGGEACTAEVAAAYATLLTQRPGGGTSFNRDAFARTQVVQGVYCPQRATELTELIRSKEAANTRARTLAAQEQAATAGAA